MAGMRLDIREEALKPKAHGTPIIPGDSANSEVVQRIFASDGRIMPPAAVHKELTAEQKDLIRRWIAEGAKYEGHWAYQPVTRPAVPPVSGSKVRNPIDAFVQARLAKEGIKPSEEADRRILIRRVTLDLTGLAPEPAQVDAFLRDRSPDAFEKVVDRLLDSPAYAEHESMAWLDAVRYADTAGYHSSWQAISCPRPPPSRRSRRLTTAWAARRQKAACSPRNTSPSTARIACARWAPTGWEARSAAPNATITNSIRCSPKIFMH
jgi:hypothetical protein